MSDDYRYLIYRYRYGGSIDEEREFVGVCDTKEIAEKYISKYSDPDRCNLEIKPVTYIEDFDINSIAVITTITTDDGESIYYDKSATIQNNNNEFNLPDIKYGDARKVPLVIVQEEYELTDDNRQLLIQVISNRKLTWDEMIEIVRKYKDKVYELLPIYSNKLEIGDEVLYHGSTCYVVETKPRSYDHGSLQVYQPELQSFIGAKIDWINPTGKHSELFEKLFKNEIDLGIITKEKKDD